MKITIILNHLAENVDYNAEDIGWFLFFRPAPGRWGLVRFLTVLTVLLRKLTLSKICPKNMSLY